MVSLLLSLSCPFLVLCCFVSVGCIFVFFFPLSLSPLVRTFFPGCHSIYWNIFCIWMCKKLRCCLEPLNSLASGVASVDSPKHTQLRNSQAGVSDLCASTSGLLCSSCRSQLLPVFSVRQRMTLVTRDEERMNLGRQTSQWLFQREWFWWEIILWIISYKMKNFISFVLSGEVGFVVAFNSVSGQRRETRAPCRITRWEFIGLVVSVEEAAWDHMKNQDHIALSLPLSPLTLTPSRQ